MLYVGLCFTDETTIRGEACLVEYLKAVGKLNSDFQSTAPPSPLVCHYAAPLAMKMVKSIILDDLKTEIPNESVCLTRDIEVQRAVENVIKIALIENSKFLIDTEKQTQVSEARKEFKAVLVEVAVHYCEADQKQFINIFRDVFGEKNETTEASQYEYCLAKYAVENNYLELGNVDLNPHKIDAESVNCDNIVADERGKAEREIRNIISVLQGSNGSMDCVLNAYRSSNAFGWQVTVKVLDYLDFSKETNESETDKNNAVLRNFIWSTISTCAKSNIK